MAKKKSQAQKRQERNARGKAKSNMKNVQRKGENHFNSPGRHPLAPSGLRNNGNTCYYNSTIQCLAQVHTLYKLLHERASKDYQWKATLVGWDEKKRTFNVEHLKLPLNGERITANLFMDLVKDILSKNSTAPSHLLDQIRSKNSQFRGFNQQDAHELCLGLISQMRDEEINMQKKAICNKFKIPSKNPTDEEKMRAQKYKYIVMHTPLDAVFGGQLVSWVKCCDCSHISLNFERFYDLSLSLPPEKPEKLNNNCRKKSSPQEEEDDYKDDDEESSSKLKSGHESESDNQKLTPAERKKKRAQRKAMRKMEKEKQKLGKKNDKEDKKGSNYSDKSSETGSDAEENNNSQNAASKEELKDIELDIQIDVLKDRNRKPVKAGGHEDLNLNQLMSEFALETISKKNREDFNKSALQVIPHADHMFDNKMLGELLKNFITIEVLQGENKYICEQCSKRNTNKTYSSKALKGQMIALPPQTLIIQLKRFETTGSSRVRGTRKCNTNVEFPLRLNLSPFTSMIYEALSLYYEPGLKVWSTKQILDYDLFATVVHLGDLQFGHYVAYIKVRKDETNSENKSDQRRFLHLKQFFPNFDHVYTLWLMAKKVRKSYESSNHLDLSPQSSSYQSSSYHSFCSSEMDSWKGSPSSKSDYNEQHHNAHHPNTPGSSSSSSDSDEDDSNEENCESSWFYCSDSNVRPCTEEEVLRNCMGQYFMLYERAT